MILNIRKTLSRGCDIMFRMRGTLRRAASMKMSVFAGTAFVVYVVGAVRYSKVMGEPYKRLPVTMQGVKSFLEIKSLPYIVVLFSFFLAIRLYLNAWYIDESVEFRGQMATKCRVIRFAEWFIRLAWVTGMTFLPEYYASSESKAGIYFGVSALVYQCIVVSLVLIWDVSFRRAIFSYTKQDKQSLQKLWIPLDALMVLMLAVAATFDHLAEYTGNWNAAVIPTMFLSTCVISLIQVLIWSQQIFERLAYQEGVKAPSKFGV